MTVSKARFDILTDTGGEFVDTGPPMSGAVVAVRYERDTGAPLDTGADFKLQSTKTGLVVVDVTNRGVASFQAACKLGVLDTGGDAVSGATAYPVLAGEPLRLTVTADTASRRGVVHVWTVE